MTLNFPGSAVTVLNEQESLWVNDVARRLRLVQAELSASSPAQRRELLQEEVARHLAAVAPALRQRCVEALLERFPVRGQAAGSLPEPSPPPPPPKPLSTEELLEQFLAQVQLLPEERRAALTRRLAEAGWVEPGPARGGLEWSDEFRQALGLAADQQPQAPRLLQLTSQLIELFFRLDATALKTLSELAPRSPLLASGRDFRQAVADFLTGATDSVEPQIRAMSGLLGGFLAAILGAGKDFGRQYVERFSPNAIEDVIKGEGKVKWWVPGSPTEKELCWDKFKDLSKDFATADLIDRRIKDSVAAFVEKKVLTRR